MLKKAEQDRQCLGPHDSRLYLHEKVINFCVAEATVILDSQSSTAEVYSSGLQLLILLNTRGSVILATAQGSRINLDSFNRFIRAVMSSRRYPLCSQWLKIRNSSFTLRSTCKCAIPVYTVLRQCLDVIRDLDFSEVIRVN